MYFHITGKATLDLLLADLATDMALSTAGSWTVTAIPGGNPTYKGYSFENAGTSIGSTYDHNLGFSIYTSKVENWNYVVLRSGTTFVNGLPSAHLSDAIPLVFTEDVSGLTFTTVSLSFFADANGISMVMGNSEEGIYNAAFYGRLVTPTGDPVDAANSTAVDVDAVALASSCTELSDTFTTDGLVQLRRDASGLYWPKYHITDHPVGHFDYFAGGLDAKLTKWGRFGKWQPMFENLFLRETYWRDKVRLMFVSNASEGIRGYIPNLYTMTNVATASAATGQIYVTPDHELMSGTCTATSSATNLYDSTQPIAILNVQVGDVVYHVPSRKYVKVTTAAVAGPGQHLVTATVAPYTWLGAEYRIYRGISFSVYQVGYDPGEQILLTGATSGGDTFVLSGNRAAAFPVGNSIRIDYDVANDGVYTIAASTYSAPNTYIRVSEEVPDPTAGGYATNTLADVAILDISETGHWVEVNTDISAGLSPGDKVAILDSTHNDGAYTVTTATLLKDRLVVSGDKTADFTATNQIFIGNSTGNDGTYTVTGDNLDVAGTSTEIYINEALPTTNNDGYLANLSHRTTIVGSFASEDKIRVDGDVTATFLPGDKFRIFGSSDAANNAEWTIAGGGSVLGKDEFTLTGDVSGDFAPGDTLFIGGLTTDLWGSYTISREYVVGGNTKYYVDEAITGAVLGDAKGGNLTTWGQTITAVDAGTETLTIAGLHAADYVLGDKIYITGSNGGTIDGVWTVQSSAEGGGNTTIIVQEDLTADPGVPKGTLIHEDHMYVLVSFEADPQTELDVTPGNITGTTATGYAVHEDYVYAITAGISEPRTRIVVSELTLDNTAPIDGTLAEAYYVVDVENNETNTVDVSINSFTSYSNRSHPAVRRRAVVLAE